MQTAAHSITRSPPRPAAAHSAAHDTRLVGVDGELPTLLKLSAREFLPALFADLMLPDWRERVAAKTLSQASGLRLLLPIHQSLHVVLLDAHCIGFGQPRLDPKKLDGMGIVIRRIAADGSELGWMRSGERILGWQALSDGQRDPDPARRPPSLQLGSVVLQQRLALRGDASAETVAPLFVAPPEVCKATGRTLLYGLVTVTSDEVTSSEHADAAAYAELDSAAFADHLSPWLTAAAPPPPSAGAAISVAEADAASDDSDIAAFLRLLGQLEYEFEIFGGAGSNLHPLLNEVRVEIPGLAATPLGDWLNVAVDVLLRRDSATTQLIMPPTWPHISADLAARIADAAQAVLRDRLAAARAANALPATTRFDSPDARYRLRAFIRIKQAGACPSRLVWGAPSAPYTLAPWFEPGDAVPAVIALPSLADFRKLKPNVSFAVPPSLQAFMQGNDAEKLVKGEGNKGGPALDVQWICSFSLPIITLCAFIVLNVFLSLFNLIFGWLAFIKICLPIPLPKKGNDGG